MPSRLIAGGIEILIRLTPKSSRDAIEGIEADASKRRYLKARVRAVPEKGAANAALVALIAGHFDVPKSAVAIVSGGTARLKTMRIEGDADGLLVRLEAAAKASR
jgi:uncharacterized protein